MDQTASIFDHATRLPHTVGSEQTISFALRLMREHHIRHLPVLHGGVLAGIVSDRDLGLVAGLNDVNPETTRVEEAMTDEVYSVPPTTPMTEVLGTMIKHKFGSTLVVDGAGKVMGIFTAHDALQLLLDRLTG